MSLRLRIGSGNRKEAGNRDAFGFWDGGSPPALPPGTFGGKVFKKVWFGADLWRSVPHVKSLAVKYSLEGS